MLEIAIMIEGQNGLTWPRWQKIVRLVEDAGFVGLFRSDHFTNSSSPAIELLELWTSLTWLACNTQRIEFGPLVTPFSFRHPVHTARMASAVDDLSNGRLVLGLGAGWNVREHHAFGFDLLEPKARFERFNEGHGSCDAFVAKRRAGHIRRSLLSTTWRDAPAASTPTRWPKNFSGR